MILITSKSNIHRQSAMNFHVFRVKFHENTLYSMKPVKSVKKFPEVMAEMKEMRFVIHKIPMHYFKD